MKKVENHIQEHPFFGLTGRVEPAILEEAAQSAVLRGVPLANILHTECKVPRQVLLQILSEYYNCPALEYDERLPIPPELLAGLPVDRLIKTGWFPVIMDDDGTMVIATTDPASPVMRAEVEELLGLGRYEFRVTLPDDIGWFIQDFLHAPVGKLIGTERTGLAFWRNNMAQWRTRLACYRTDMAKAWTSLAFMRMGLSLSTFGRTMLSSAGFHAPTFLSYSIITIGLIAVIAALPIYMRVRRSRLTPPRNQTLMEVTAANLLFLEGYQNLEHVVKEGRTKETMLARMGDLLANYCTILWPVPGSQERTHLARERNVLAAQRTIAACYRTIYARARTGLAFIRTGVSFLGIGIGLISYFGVSLETFFDAMLVLIGFLMIIDGALWYLPVRKEQAELPRSRSAVLAE